MTLLREAGNFLSAAKTKVILSDGDFHRTSSLSLSDIKSVTARNTNLNSVSGTYVEDVCECGNRALQFARGSNWFVESIIELARQQSIHAHALPACMSLKVDENCSRVLHSNRASSSQIQDHLSEGVNRNFSMWRYYYTGIGSHIPAPSCSTTIIRHIEKSSGMKLSVPSMLLQRWYGVIGVIARRKSDTFLGTQEMVASCIASLNRDAQDEIPSLNVEVCSNRGREVLFGVSPIGISASRTVINHVHSFIGIPAIGLSAFNGSVIFRESTIEVSSLRSSVNRTGSFNRVSSASVFIVGADGLGEGFIERFSTACIGNSSISVERVLCSSRDSAFEIAEPCVIAFGATNADRPFAPFEIVIDRPDYVVVVDKPEYVVELDKGLFYAVIREGLTMIEITQYDTDTFYGYLYDTDPVTGDSRSMPLSGKTVKAALVGGNPDTSVIVDCTVVEDGKVRVDLTSANTAVVGKYHLSFVVLSEGYRKEIPECRDDYLEVFINDAKYPNL